MASLGQPFGVVRTPAFILLMEEYASKHHQLEKDISWLEKRLEQAPEVVGERVPQLQGLGLPIFKTRAKDSCHNIGASGGWRIYYAIDKEKRKVRPLFLHHKREYENPAIKFLVQKIESALSDSLKKLDEEGDD